MSIKFGFTSVLYFLTIYHCVQGIDTWINESNRSPKIGISHHIETVSEMMEMLVERRGNDSTSLQDATENLLFYVALLRNKIAENFGQYTYDHYQNFTITEITSLHDIYRKILARQVDIIGILPKILKSGNIKPATICRYIYQNSAAICTNIPIIDNNFDGDIMRAPAFAIAQRTLKFLQLSRRNEAEFSLSTVLDHLRSGKIKLTFGLFLGLLHNVQYDNYGSEIRDAERRITRDLYGLPEREITKSSVINDILRNPNSIGQLLKYYLTAYSDETSRDDGRYLAEHILDAPGIVDENIESLGFIYENGLINIKYLLELVLPNDTLDCDVFQARENVKDTLEPGDFVERLKIDKYHQTSPDQLLLDILSRLQEINWMRDDASALYIHARFWRQSHMIENLAQLLELFNAFDNLRQQSQHKNLIDTIDQIKDHLIGLKTTSIEFSCTNPRKCLTIGLKIIAGCDGINDATQKLISHFLELYNCRCFDVNETYFLYTTPTSIEKPLSTTLSVAVDDSSTVSVYTSSEKLADELLNPTESIGVKNENNTDRPVASCENCEDGTLATFSKSGISTKHPLPQSESFLLTSTERSTMSQLENISCTETGCNNSIKPTHTTIKPECNGAECITTENSSSEATTDSLNSKINEFSMTTEESIEPEKFICHHRDPHHRRKFAKLRKIRKSSTNVNRKAKEVEHKVKLLKPASKRSPSLTEPEKVSGKTHNSLSKTSSSQSNADLNNTEMRNRMLDFNFQKFFNLEVKRDEISQSTNVRQKRHIDEKTHFRHLATLTNSLSDHKIGIDDSQPVYDRFKKASCKHSNETGTALNDTDIKNRIFDFIGQKLLNFVVKRDEITMNNDVRSRRNVKHKNVSVEFGDEMKNNSDAENTRLRYRNSPEINNSKIKPGEITDNIKERLKRCAKDTKILSAADMKENNNSDDRQFLDFSNDVKSSKNIRAM